MKNTLDLSEVPADQRKRINNLVSKKIDRLWHRLENLSYTKAEIDVQVVQRDNRWRVAVDLSSPQQSFCIKAQNDTEVDTALEKAFTEIVRQSCRQQQEKKNQRHKRRYKMDRDDRSQFQAEIQEALREVNDQQNYRFVCSHLPALRREAGRLMNQEEQQDPCLSVDDIVQEAILEMHQKVNARPENYPLTTWFSGILSEVIERNRRRNLQTTSFSETVAEFTRSP